MKPVKTKASQLESTSATTATTAIAAAAQHLDLTIFNSPRDYRDYRHSIGSAAPKRKTQAERQAEKAAKQETFAGDFTPSHS